MIAALTNQVSGEPGAAHKALRPKLSSNPAAKIASTGQASTHGAPKRLGGHAELATTVTVQVAGGGSGAGCLRDPGVVCGEAGEGVEDVAALFAGCG
jgi:hypothetical protein